MLTTTIPVSCLQSTMNSHCRYGCVYLYVWFRLSRWWSRPHRKFHGHVDDQHRRYRRSCPRCITHSIHNDITDLLLEQNMESLIQSEEQKTHQKWPKDSIVGTKWVAPPFEIVFNVNSLLDCYNYSVHYCCSYCWLSTFLWTFHRWNMIPSMLPPDPTSSELLFVVTLRIRFGLRRSAPGLKGTSNHQHQVIDV